VHQLSAPTRCTGFSTNAESSFTRESGQAHKIAVAGPADFLTSTSGRGLRVNSRLESSAIVRCPCILQIHILAVLSTMMCPGDLVLKAPPGMFLVERFSKIEMLNVECSSSLNSPRENVLAETDSCTHSTSRNLLIEGHIRVDSSNPHLGLKSYVLNDWSILLMSSEEYRGK
jgi:hypothetical protein